MNNQATGALIRDLRKEKKLTQKELAERLHVTDRACLNGRGGSQS